MTVKRMDNVLIVVDDLEAAKAFFVELGLELEGETTVEGPLVGSLIGLNDVRATLAMLRTPDGQGIELDKFHTPNAIRFGPVDAPVNTLGIRRVMFAVDDIDAVVGACAPAGPSSSAKCSTGTRTGWPTSAGRRESSSRLPSSSARVASRAALRHSSAAVLGFSVSAVYNGGRRSGNSRPQGRRAA